MNEKPNFHLKRITSLNPNEKPAFYHVSKYLGKPIINRRDFLKTSAFGLAYLAGCSERVIDPQTAPITTGPITTAELSAFAHEVGAQIGLSTIAFSPDGKLIATGGLGLLHEVVDGKAVMSVKLWEFPSGRLLQSITSARTRAIDFSRDGGILAVGGFFGTYLRLFSIPSGIELVRVEAKSPIYSIAFSPGQNGTFLASGHQDGELKIWRVPSGNLFRTLRGRSNETFNSVTFSPDGSILASGSGNGSNNEIKFWEPVSGTLLRTITGEPNEHINSVAFSSDGRILVSGSQALSENSLKLWDVQTGERIAVLGKEKGVASAKFSADGNYLTYSTPEGVKVWDVVQGKLVKGDLINMMNTGWAFAYSPDGRFLATRAGFTVKLWTFPELEFITCLFDPEATRRSVNATYYSQQTELGEINFVAPCNSQLPENVTIIHECIKGEAPSSSGYTGGTYPAFTCTCVPVIFWLP